MLNKVFHELLTKLSELTYTQSKQLQNHLNNRCSIEGLRVTVSLPETVENIIGQVKSCPHCKFK